ncbi:unnamed protein product [Paramecium primaurelia]|uniref:Transmembrane protein n=1 Tax=Paramecium primaurelia TaxID=5886 RepID=A0A8S1NL28_PARPR|nr:unnamed protein product [Paramecium primaurelia]
MNATISKIFVYCFFGIILIITKHFLSIYIQNVNCLRFIQQILQSKLSTFIISLLEIRKWKVLKGAAEKNVKTIYVPLKTQEQGKNETSNLMGLYQFDDKDGEVNEFLYERKTLDQAKVLQPKIFKSLFGNIAIKKLGIMYQYLFIFHYRPQKPVFQAVEESLKQDDYGFDDLQLKECKEMLQTKEFRFMFIMDSYDEMKLENIQKNLYINNKLKQNWSDPLVIFTTKSDIFTSSNYAYWFAPEIIKDLKQSSFFSLNRVKNKISQEIYDLKYQNVNL